MLDIKRYYICSNGCSAYIVKEMESKCSDEHIDIKTTADGEYFSVNKSDVVDVLVSTKGLTLEELIKRPEFDKGYYLHHLGGASFNYKGFTLEVFGEQSTFYRGKQIFKHPELLIELSKELYFGDSSWIEIVDNSNLDKEYEPCGSFKEAKEAVDNIVKNSLPDNRWWNEELDMLLDNYFKEEQGDSKHSRDYYRDNSPLANINNYVLFLYESKDREKYIDENIPPKAYREIVGLLVEPEGER